MRARIRSRSSGADDALPDRRADDDAPVLAESRQARIRQETFDGGRAPFAAVDGAHALVVQPRGQGAVALASEVALDQLADDGDLVGLVGDLVGLEAERSGRSAVRSAFGGDLVVLALDAAAGVVR